MKCNVSGREKADQATSNDDIQHEQENPMLG